MKKVVLITGTSSGIGLQTALLLAKNNYTVYATMRDTGKKELLQKEADLLQATINIMKLDVQLEESIGECVKRRFLKTKTGLTFSSIMQDRVFCEPLNRQP